MPKITMLPHGVIAGVAPSTNAHPRAKREACNGWSYSSIRSNTRFLYSIEEPGLSGLGVSVTLTVRHCPPTHADWARLRVAFLRRLDRAGLLRCHWVTEWQRRKVPHLHGALWFPEGSQWVPTLRLVMNAWLDVASAYEPLRRSQTAKPMYDAVGWFAYVSKHAARGLSHYQRDPDSVPPGWQGSTGRMWGHRGKWPVREAVGLELSMPAFHAYRRLVRTWRKADARASGSVRRIVQARRMLQCPDPGLSAVRGVSEWMELDDSMRLITIVAAMGHDVTQVWQDKSEISDVNDSIEGQTEHAPL